MNQLPDNASKNLALSDEPFLDAKFALRVGRMSARIGNLLKRGGRAAVIFVASFLAVKALDKAAETHPDNKLVNGADQIANVVFGVESMLVGGVLMVGEAGYEAVTKPPVAELPKEKPTAKNDAEQLNELQPHRNRANLDAALAVDVIQSPLLSDSQQKQPSTTMQPTLRAQEFRP